MKTEDWQMLVALEHTENITLAAEQLFVSQPTLTSRIQKLEEHYGVALIIRKQRGIMFTPEGELLCAHAKRILRQEREMEEAIHNSKKQVSGTLRLGVSNFFATHKIPRLLRLFKQSYPHVEFQIVTGWSSDMYRLVLNHDVHIGFIKGDFSWKGKKQLLYEEEICIAAPWDVTLEQLPELPRIDYRTDEQMKQLVDSWWYRNYQKPANINIQVNQVETCKEMILNGLGYGILANLVVRSYPEIITLPLTLPDGKAVTRATSMYYQESTLQLNIVKAFVDFIQTVDVKAL